MQLIALTLSLALAHLVNSAAVPMLPTMLYSTPTDYKPAFCKVIHNPTTGENDLAYSSFTGNPRANDRVLRYPDVSINYLDKTKMVANLVTEAIIWPNEVAEVPEGMFGSSHYWSSASAFFLAGKDDGSISLIDVTDPANYGEPLTISSTENGKKWYYHRVLWHDMDNDGDMDAITARAYGTATSTVEAELLWFENPGSPTPNWEPHVIHKKEEDVFFSMHDMPLPDGSSTLVIFSSGFFSQALTLTWTADGDWLNPSSIQHRIIDNFGWYFDVKVGDLNADGKIDLLATTWSRPDPGYPGALIVYEMPEDDWRTGDWKRTILSTDFPSYPVNGMGSPGSAEIFWPTQDMKLSGEKPHLVVAGDDDGEAYLFIPNSSDPTDWTYMKTTIFETAGTVGGIDVADVDGDGYSEIFIPAYDAEELVVMTYKP